MESPDLPIGQVHGRDTGLSSDRVLRLIVFSGRLCKTDIVIVCETEVTPVLVCLKPILNQSFRFEKKVFTPDFTL